MKRHRIPDRSAAAFEIDADQRFQVINPGGTQVADLVAFNRADTTEAFSAGQTRASNDTLRISTGDSLRTNLGNDIMTITRDDCGVHDLLYPPCDERLLSPPYAENEPGGCLENLTLALEPWGITERTLPQPLNAFQEATVSPEYYIHERPSPAEAGDVLAFRVETDAVVAVSACSEQSPCSRINGEELTPIDLLLPERTDVHDATVQPR